MEYKMVRCADVLDVRDGTHDSPKYVLEGYPLITSKNIKEGNIEFDNVNYITKDEFDKINARSKVDDGDILMPMIGTIGNPVIVNTEMPFAIKNVALFKFRGNSNFDNRYVYYALKSPIVINQLNSNKRGGTQSFVSLGNIRDLKIPNITIDTQKKIATILDKAQSLIDKRKEQIEACDELVKSRFIEMFGNLKNEEELPLEDCTTFIDYRGKTPVLSESGIRIINAKSVGNGFFKYIDEYISEDTYNSWMKRGFPVAGDVLFVTEGHTFGNVCRIPSHLKKFAMGQRVITMQGKSGLLNNVFLAQYMQSMSFKIDIDKYKTGSSAQGIRSKELQKILIPIPPIELQNQFADFVKQVDKLKFEMEQSLKELENNFNSLMQRAFKGELFNGI